MPSPSQYFSIAQFIAGPELLMFHHGQQIASEQMIWTNEDSEVVE
jgi:hypothetical protein